jgi:hypothetical protein
MLFAACEEYYTPKIDNLEGQLVVDALITNDITKNHVFLSKTLGFYNNRAPQAALNATVQLVDKEGITLIATESSPGSFFFKSVPVLGSSYKLRINYQNNIYESELVAMPSPPKIFKTYSGDKVKTTYKPDSYGAIMTINNPGRDIYIDAPATSTLTYYRFSTRSIIEWYYSPPTKFGPPPPPIYGWESFIATDKFDIAGPKAFSQSDTIKKHQLVWLADDSKYYLFSDTLAPNGWIIIVDQFGTSKGSYEFHEKINRQFGADGALFDPIQTQIYGNIKCKTDLTKTVYGYFDLNSCRQYRYYVKSYSSQDINLRQILRYPYISNQGQTTIYPSEWWEN